MSRIAIIDYGLCNLDSIYRAIEECGGNPFVTSNPESLNNASKVILPGVGAFGEAMENLRKTGMADSLERNVFENNIPFLGICLGMQLMSKGSDEDSGFKGLGWLDAQVVKMKPQKTDERIPHVGWNEVNVTVNHPLLDGIKPGTDFYFVHSYHLDCHTKELITGVTPYCGSFTSIVTKDNLMGVQFHPEKSQKNGFLLLRNFLKN